MTTTTTTTTTTITTGLIQMGAIFARFLMVGNIVERGGHFYTIRTLGVQSEVRPTHMVFVVESEEGQMETLEIHGGVEVALWEEVTQEELEAHLGL